MRYPMARTHLATCRHEAAHCIIGESFGIKVSEVHAPIFRKKHKGGRGYCQFRSLRGAGPIQVAVTMMAGSVAEHLWHGTPKGLASHGDFVDMKRSGLRGEDFRIVWEEASRLVRRNKVKIWKLAKRLQSGEVIYR